MEGHKDRGTVDPVVVKLAFNWGAQYRYTELMNFKMEVLNILDIKAYKLSKEEKVQQIKNWLDQKGLQLTQTLTWEKKNNVELQNVPFHSIVQQI